MSLEVFPLQLSRHAFGPRDTARAGDVWRLFQDAAVVGSARRGWSPERYRAEGCAFVVRTMSVVHERPVRFGEPLQARTWVSGFRRDMFSQRQVHIESVVADREPETIARASQKWVHVAMPDMAPARASAALLASFEAVGPADDVVLPALASEDPGAPHLLELVAWHTWMDPLAHANHPAYLDWADEALSRVVADRGADPQGLRAVGGTLTWRSGVVAPEAVAVRVQRLGATERGDVVLGVTITGGDGRACADGRVVRAHDDLDLSALLD
jgi:acyl-CoA thioesterase FadM